MSSLDHAEPVELDSAFYLSASLLVDLLRRQERADLVKLLKLSTEFRVVHGGRRVQSSEVATLREAIRGVLAEASEQGDDRAPDREQAVPVAAAEKRRWVATMELQSTSGQRLVIDPVVWKSLLVLVWEAADLSTEALVDMAKVPLGARSADDGSILTPLEVAVVRSVAAAMLADTMLSCETPTEHGVLEVLRLLKDYGFADPPGITIPDLVAKCGQGRDYRHLKFQRVMFEFEKSEPAWPAVLERLFRRYCDVSLLGLTLRGTGDDEPRWYVEAARHMEASE